MKRKEVYDDPVPLNQCPIRANHRSGGDSAGTVSVISAPAIPASAVDAPIVVGGALINT